MGFFRTAARLAVLGGAAAGAAYIARKQGLLGGGGELPSPKPVQGDDWAPETRPEEVVQTPGEAAEPGVAEGSGPEPAQPAGPEAPGFDDPPPPTTENDAPAPPPGEPVELEEDDLPEVVDAEARPADVNVVVDDLLGPDDAGVTDAEVVDERPEKP